MCWEKYCLMVSFALLWNRCMCVDFYILLSLCQKSFSFVKAKWFWSLLENLCSYFSDWRYLFIRSSNLSRYFDTYNVIKIFLVLFLKQPLLSFNSFCQGVCICMHVCVHSSMHLHRIEVLRFCISSWLLGIFNVWMCIFSAVL